MKKACISISISSLLIILLCLNVFSAPSPETSGFKVEIESATDANGNEIIIGLKEADKVITSEAMKTETIKAVMGDMYTEDMIIVDIQDVTVPAGTVFPVTITFILKGVTADTKGGLMHWTGSVWEWIDAIFNTDTMTCTFKSLSPVAFVVNADVTQNRVGTSPQTSDCITSVFTSLAVSAAVILVFSKKCRITK